MEVSPLLRYAGGKFYARKLIRSYFPRHNKYCEPFVGGGSVFFSKPEVRSVLNDKDQELMNLYAIVKTRPQALISLCYDVEVSKEKHKFFKEQFVPKNELERAFRWFYLNRTSYSGIMKKENCFFGHEKGRSLGIHDWPARILQCSNKLNDTQLLSVDFEEAISIAGTDCFFFIDPPYFKADQKKFYTQFFTHEDHIRLANF